MKDIKPLTIEETALKEEMKSRCLNKGQYIDEKAEDKFKMLCHLEDFEVQYWELKDKIKTLNNQLDRELIKRARLENRINKIEHYINCHATDFDDGRWNLELTEIELNELQEILRGGNK